LEVIEEIGAKATQGSKEIDIGRGEPEICQVFKDVSESRKDEIGPVGRVLAKKRLKVALSVFPLCQ